MAGNSWWGRSSASPPAFASPSATGCGGTAAATLQTQLVEDVHAFPGHIACDAASRSELVVPIVHDGRLIGVLDLDSPTPARFDAADAAGCEALMAVLGPRIAG
ncbi:GAF domain-containing protein [Sphingomonas sp. Ant H11]|uniref:GAF domain-containing protein n=1 Tax=Sphingomonas sp. Ant H11 TaxID=1564113 RepID=UPI001E313C99|nr:GAF domain-containing protein [Sphingomonas sp. Ant H11]